MDDPRKTSQLGSLLDKVIRWLRFRKIVGHIPQGAVVCDIGCGENAFLLRSIAPKISRGYGFDISVKSFEDQSLKISEYDLQGVIPLADQSVHVVTLLAVLEHLSRPQEILNEIFRVLKPGGILLLTAPTPLAKPILEFLAFRLHLIDEASIRDHKTYFWHEDLKRMLTEAGFSPQNLKHSYFELYCNNDVVVEKQPA
jgi:ubiquinone/menaquinone biosynthesis C-methylase UbiE